MNYRKTGLALSLIGTFCLAAPSLVMADEVTTTTTTKKTDPTVVVAPPAVGVVEDKSDCSKQKTTKTDADTGDTVTKTKTNCD